MTYFRNFIKNLLLYLLTGFIILFVGFIYIEKNPEPSYAQMAAPPASEYTDFAQCMGAELAQYMNALITAQQNGQIPSNIKLLSPAFNMTSWTFGAITQAMNDHGANFSGLAGIAGNLYHTGNNSISSTYVSNGIQSTFGGLPLFILETGCSNPAGNDYNGCHQGLANEYQELSQIANVEAFIPFNPTNSNQDFSHHQMSDSQLQQLCNVQGCGAVGINYGTHFGSSDTSATNNFGFGYNVQIANNDNGSAQAVINQTNGNSANTIIRIGVGEDDGGGFTDVNEYIEFLAQVGNGAADPNKPIYAIAGPNEPDLEYWLFQQCAILFPEQARRMLQTCRGQLDIENQAYRTTVIGFGGIQPFVLEGAVQQETGSEDDLAKEFGATLIVKAALLHPNTKPIRDTYGGSIDPASPLYINNRTDMEHINLPAINMALPETDIQGGFGVPPQAPLGKTEAYDAYTKRIYQTSYIQNKLELGLDEDIPVVRFNACIQRAGCDPAKEECLSGENAGIVFKPDGTPCDPNVDEYCIESYSVTRNRCGENAENCLTNGTVFPFTGEIVMEEPTSLMVKGKAFEDIMAASLAEIPDDSFYTQHGGSTALVDRTGVNTISDALAMNNDFEQKHGLLAQQNAKGKQELARRANSTTIIESLSEPTEANAQVAESLSDGTYQRTSCKNGYGMSLLVENKGSYYGVKAWDTQTVGTDGKACEDLHDYGWEVEYFMNGTKVASCGSTMQGQGRPLPTYQDQSCLADGSCNPRQVYGMSVSDMCPIPFSPADGELSVNFRITHSNAPYHEGCTQTAQCLCDGPECQVNNAVDQAGVDCRICPTWAPPSLCSKIVAKDIVNERQCVNGSCIATEIKVEDELPFNFDSSWNIDPWGWGAWLASIASPIFPSRLKCEEKSVVVDQTTGATNDTYKCSYNATNYHVYMYPTQLVADSSLNNMHMRVNDFMFSMPDYTDKWFNTEPRKAPLQLALNIDEFFTDRDPNEVNIATGFDAGTFTPQGAGENFVWLGISKKDGSVRTTDIEYPNYGQPISSGYCLNQMFLAPPLSEERTVPKTAAQSGLCDFGFMPGSMAYKQHDLAQKYPTIIAKFNNDSFEKAANQLEISSIENSKEQSPVILSARTASEQLEISTKSNSTDFIPTPAYERKVKAYLSSLTPKQMEQFQLEIMNDMYVLTGKNWHLRDKSNSNYISPEMQKDMDALKMKYDRKMGLN